MSVDQQNIQSNEISWTDQELQAWVDAGLVPGDLLRPPLQLELFSFLMSNKEILHANHRRDLEKDHYEITVPPQCEWDKAPDLRVIDRRTGEVVQVLEMAADFELCEGIYFKIRAKEVEDWKKETVHAKDLNKEQHETLKAALEKIGSRPLSRAEIVTLIEEIRKVQSSKTFRQSRELIDNKLDRSNERNQLTIFDFFDKQNKKVEELHPERPIIKGLNLDQGEDRLLHTLTLLLSKKSENRDQNSNEFYMGNYKRGVVSINQVEMETARITVSPHELYSTYYGREDYNADHIKYVLNKLDCLSKKMFLTCWKFLIQEKGNAKAKNKKGKRYDMFRTFCPLFAIAILNSDLSESECQTIENNKDLLEGKRCQFLFKFQPQFTNNIREQYVEFPSDIYLRIAAAIDKDRFSTSINLMRDFLFREKQQKRYEIVRDKETIINVLKLDKFLKEGRRKKVDETIEECVRVFTKIGLLTAWEVVQGKMGQEQYRIQISRDFK